LKALENQNNERLQVEAARLDPARFAELYENNFERVYAYIAHRVSKAIEAVRQWKFEPSMKEGHPVAVQVNIEVSFRLY
jgi:Gram-negative bacterial TonB protein C-terminal